MNKTTIKLLFIAAALFFASQATNHAQSNKSATLNGERKSQADDDEFSEREEVTRTFRLAPGATVEVSTIYGAVDIETSNTGTAEIQIIRYARNHIDFSDRKINIEQTASGLTVRGERDASQ